MVTKTTNRIHFDDLSPTRFEDMCVQIIYRMRRWDKIQHFGRKGKDRGVDIYTETISDSVVEKWFIQCKRYQDIALSQLKGIIDDLVKTNKVLPDRYLLILSCDISRDTFEEFQKYAIKKGVLNSDVMTSSILETILYAHHPDLLYNYFGVNVVNPRVATLTKVKRRLSMKRKIEEAFSGKRRGLEVIIRDVHRDIYPNLDLDIPGISPWFKLEYFRTYHRGISFFTGIINVQVNEAGEWKIVEYDDKVPDGWININAFQIGNIPYDNLVEIDMEGDEFYPFPHIYCEFNSLGQPYEEIWYEPTDAYKNQVFELERDKRLLNNP